MSIHQLHDVRSPRPPDHAFLIDFWMDGEGLTFNSGANVTSWTGRKLGIVVPFTGTRPTYGLDGVTGNGRPAVQCTAAGASLYASGLSSFASSGTRPYLISQFRYRTAPTTGQVHGLLCIGVSGVVDSQYMRADFSGNARLVLTTAAGTLVGQSPLTTTQHCMESWADGTNINVRVDGTLSQTASNFSISHNQTTIGMANSAGAAGVQRSDTSHWFHAIFSAYPGDAYSLTLRAWLKHRYG